ncbi:MAG: recombinase family protein, partial [Actinophytocola sp.]|nr:recombinase family protein [Actinophytocola sp.]
MGILGAVRLSKYTDTSTSVERQHEVIRWWSDGHDGELVHTTEDIDVSGSVSPFERDGLGPWLTDPEKVRQWEVLVAWKLDRISRNARDTLELLTWAEANGKRIVCVDDSIDTESEMGRFFLQLAAIFAELERKTIAARILKG